MLIKTYGSAVYGISAQLITVEVDVGQGAKTQIIGLPDNAVKESQPRVNAAMKNCGYTYPRKGVVINMAPADIRKEGSSYDLTIAIGVMAAGELIAADLLEESIIMGELSLDGSILPIKGALPIAIQAQKDGYKRLIVPKENAREAAIVKDLEVYGMDNLKDVVELLEGTKEFERTIVNPRDEFANRSSKFSWKAKAAN
jgi:magnesium chelatase family protein